MWADALYCSDCPKNMSWKSFKKDLHSPAKTSGLFGSAVVTVMLLVGPTALCYKDGWQFHTLNSFHSLLRTNCNPKMCPVLQHGIQNPTIPLEIPEQGFRLKNSKSAFNYVSFSELICTIQSVLLKQTRKQMKTTLHLLAWYPPFTLSYP